jgi:hypothetical protein
MHTSAFCRFTIITQLTKVHSLIQRPLWHITTLEAVTPGILLYKHLQDFTCSGLLKSILHGVKLARSVHPPYLVHGLPSVVHLWRSLLCGLIPFPVQIGARGIGPQVATPCAVRVHIGHLHTHPELAMGGSL